MEKVNYTRRRSTIHIWELQCCFVKDIKVKYATGTSLYHSSIYRKEPRAEKDMSHRNVWVIILTNILLPFAKMNINAIL